MATNDVVEKAFCDEEMADTTAKKDEPSGDSGKANAKINVDRKCKRRKMHIDADAAFAYRVQQEED